MTFERDAETRKDNDMPAPLGVRHDTPHEAGPLSWRDVYTAVRDSEDRVVKAIGDAVAPVWDASKDHDRRLREMENNNAGADHELRLRLVEKSVDKFFYRESGIMSTLGAGKTLLLFLVAVLSPFITIALFGKFGP